LLKVIRVDEKRTLFTHTPPPLPRAPSFFPSTSSYPSLIVGKTAAAAAAAATIDGPVRVLFKSNHLGERGTEVRFVF
jgi:hypothetical protein